MDFCTVPEAVSHYARVTPHKTMLMEGASGKECTYSEFWRYAGAFAKTLAEGGVKKGDRVLIEAAQSINCVVALYGTVLAGGVAIPFEKNLSEERVKAMADYFETTFVVALKQPPFACAYFPLEDAGEAKRETYSECALPDPDDPCMILYTTGTTGRSKGVMLSFKNRFAGSDNYAVAADLSATDVAFLPVPLSHMGAVRRMDALFLRGGSVVLTDGVQYLNVIFKIFANCKVTVINLVPAQLTFMLEKGAEKLMTFDSQLRLVSVGSALTPERHKEKLREILPHARLFVTYGSTEAAGTCNFEYSKYPPMPYCVGGDGLHSKIVFVDEDGNPVEHATPENPAIVATEGDTVMRGYWKDRELTEKTVINNRLISADLGYRDANGFAYVIGRRDDVIIMGGLKISPFEVENAAMEFAGIAECACVPVPDKFAGQVPKLFVVMKDGFVFSQDEITDHLKTKLEPYKIPRVIAKIDALPRTAGVGKISRKDLMNL